MAYRRVQGCLSTVGSQLAYLQVCVCPSVFEEHVVFVQGSEMNLSSQGTMFQSIVQHWPFKRVVVTRLKGLDDVSKGND